MAYTISPVWGAGAQLFDNNGTILSGGKVYVYLAGTTTPATTYTDPLGAAANTNPIVANAAGRLATEIWFSIGSAYKFVLKDANDVLIATYDNIPSSPQPPIANSATNITFDTGYVVTAGGFTVGATYQITSVGTTDFVAIGALANTPGLYFVATGVGSGTGTATYNRTVRDKLFDVISVKDFGAVGDGVADDTVALNAAANSARLTGRGIYLPATKDYYKVTDTVDFRQISKIEGKSALIQGDIGAKSLVRAGNTTKAYIWLEVRSIADSSSTAGNVGIELDGLFVSKCYLYARGFNEGIKIYPSINNWFVSCSFTILNLYNNDNQVHIDLTNSGTYFIGNQFHGGNYNGPGSLGNNDKGVFKLSLGAGTALANVDVYNAEIGIFGARNATNYALINIANSSAIGYNCIKFINCRCETYGPFTQPVYWLKIANNAAPNYFYVDMHFTTSAMDTNAIGLVELGTGNNNRFYLREDESAISNTNHRNFKPPPVQFVQANSRIRATNRVMYDINASASPVYEWSANISNLQQRALFPNDVYLTTAGTMYGLRYTKDALICAMLVLPQRQSVYVRCYDALGNQLYGVAPAYCAMQTLDSGAYFGAGQYAYRGLTKTIWLHRDVTRFEVYVSGWTGSTTAIDAQGFEVVYGRDIAYEASGFETAPNLLVSNAAIETFFPVGAVVNGTGTNGWRNTFYHRTTLASTAASAQPDIVVTDATGVSIGCRVAVALDAAMPNTTRKQYFHAAVINVVGTTITLGANIPSSATAGNDVLFNNWVAL